MYDVYYRVFYVDCELSGDLVSVDLECRAIDLALSKAPAKREAVSFTSFATASCRMPAAKMH